MERTLSKYKGTGFGFYFDLVYGGLDTPYGSNNMKITKEGSLDVWITWTI